MRKMGNDEVNEYLSNLGDDGQRNFSVYVPPSAPIGGVEKNLKVLQDHLKKLRNEVRREKQRCEDLKNDSAPIERPIDWDLEIGGLKDTSAALDQELTAVKQEEASLTDWVSRAALANKVVTEKVRNLRIKDLESETKEEKMARLKREFDQKKANQKKAQELLGPKKSCCVIM